MPVTYMSCEVIHDKFDSYTPEVVAASYAKYMQWFVLIDAKTMLLKQVRTPWQKLTWHVHQTFIILLQIIQMIKLTCQLMAETEDELNAQGDFFRYFGGDRNSYNLATILFALVPLIMVIYMTYVQRKETYKKKLRELYLPLDVIAGRFEPEAIGLSEEDLGHLRKRAKIALLLSIGTTIGFTFTWLSYSGYIMFSHLDLDRYLIQGLLNWTNYCTWILFSVALVMILLSYYHLTCMILGMRIKNMTNKLVQLNGKVAKNGSTIALIIEHNSVCRRVSLYNVFWRVFIFANYAGLLPLISICIYFALILEVDLIFKIIFGVLLLEISALVSFTVLSAALISTGLQKCYILLLNLTNKKNLSKFVRTKLKYVLTRFDGNHVTGFTCGDLFVVTKRIYVKVCKKLEVILMFYM